MSKPINNIAKAMPRPESASGDGDQRRNQTLTRIRAALLQDKLAVMTLTNENTGTDPYNSGVHQALGKATAWHRRSR
jgi:hypothetical protein